MLAEVKNVLKSKITDENEDEEVDLSFIDEIMAQLAANKNDP